MNAKSKFDTDRYCTPPEILDLIAVFWPHGIGLDPCWDPDSIVKPRVKIDEREGGDGLSADWGQLVSGSGPQTVWLNPPYSFAKPWLKLATMMALLYPEIETVALITVASGCKYWENWVWPQYAALGFIASPRLKYLKMGVQMEACCRATDHALVHYAGTEARKTSVARFRNVFSRRCAKILV